MFTIAKKIRYDKIVFGSDIITNVLPRNSMESSDGKI